MRPRQASSKAANAASDVKSPRASARVSFSARAPASGRLSVHVLAGHRCVEPQKRVLRFHRSVASARQTRPRGLEAAPRIGARDARGADPILRPGHVGGGVRGLDRRDDAVLREPRKVLGRDDLRVLDAGPIRALRRLRQGLPRALEGVEGDAIASIADGMDPELPARPPGASRDLGQPLGRRHEQAALAGLVRVVRQERRAAAAQRAVGVGLDRADGQEVGPSADARSLSRKPPRVRGAPARRSHRSGSAACRRRPTAKAPRPPPGRIPRRPGSRSIRTPRRTPPRPGIGARGPPRSGPAAPARSAPSRCPPGLRSESRRAASESVRRRDRASRRRCWRPSAPPD